MAADQILLKKYIERNGITLRIMVYFQRAYYSYATYKHEPTGYFIEARPVQIARNTEGEIVSESYTMFVGIAETLLLVNRKSDKAGKQALEMAADKEEDLISQL